MNAPVATRALLARAFGWGSAMALVRLACSFLSIKVTAVVLGPAGLVLVAQFSSLVTLLQSMLGQGLVTGSVRQAAACGADTEARRRIHATALRMGTALAGVAALALAAGAGPLAAWLLADRALAPLIALAALAVAAAMWTDVLHGALGVSKEVGLIARSIIAATVLGLALFAGATHLWGLTGALTASVAVCLAAAAVATAMVHWRARGVALRDFVGPFDRASCRQILGVYPMLIVHGAVTPLALILVRDTLASSLGLEAAGFWQAAWRLSEAYLALIVSSVTLVFMPSLGERSGQPQAQRRQILRMLVTATAVVAAAAAAVCLLREDIVRVVFSGRFEPVAALMPVQLAGDVLKIAGWILCMALVATLRTRWFVAITLLGAACFVAGTRALVPQLGLHAAPWAYLATGTLQTLLAVWALRDLLWQPRAGATAAHMPPEPASPVLGTAEFAPAPPSALPTPPGGVAR